MDHMQKAIDKAREERQGRIGGDKTGQETEGAQQRAESGEQVGAIHYTQTRQAELSSSLLEKNRIYANASHDPRADIYRQLRTQVLQKIRVNDWKTLAVTSPNDSAGKTVTAVNLAIALSKEVNQTVLLVDLDLGNPGVHKALGIDVEFGLIDHLKGNMQVPDLLINPGLERLVLLPGRPDPDYSSEILTAPKMQALLKDLVSRYEDRVIIFDMPSLLGNDDALIFLPFVDAALLVLEDGVTTPDEVAQSMQMLEATELLGSVLNKVQ